MCRRAFLYSLCGAPWGVSAPSSLVQALQAGKTQILLPCETAGAQFFTFRLPWAGASAPFGLNPVGNAAKPPLRTPPGGIKRRLASGESKFLCLLLAASEQILTFWGSPPAASSSATLTSVL